MKLGLLLLSLIVVLTINGMRPQSSDFLGRWKVEMTYTDRTQRTLYFEAKGAGKGVFQFETPESNWVEPTRPTDGKWLVEKNKNVTFMGPVQFPIGNVGREAGTAVFKGKFQSEALIEGEFAFFQEGQDPNDPKVTPSKYGKFKATRE